MPRRHHFTCTLCEKPWSFYGENPDGHTQVPCPKCLKQINTEIRTRVTEITMGLERNILTAPPELANLRLGMQELALRMALLEKGLPMEKLLGPPPEALQ